MNTGEPFVIDAQVVMYAYQEDVGHPPPGSGSASDFFASVIAQSGVIYMDNAGHIYEEWSRNLSTEWFDYWYFDLVTTANVREVDTDGCSALMKKLRQLGFPSGENRWLIKVGVSVASPQNPCALVTEDMDFREPSKKGCPPKERARYLASQVKGSVCDELWKHKVEVISLELALDP